MVFVSSYLMSPKLYNNRSMRSEWIIFTVHRNNVDVDFAHQNVLKSEIHQHINQNNKNNNNAMKWLVLFRLGVVVLMIIQIVPYPHGAQAKSFRYIRT